MSHAQATAEDRDLLLTALTVMGLFLGSLGRLAADPAMQVLGFTLAYLAGGIPPGLSALRSLVRDRVLDIDLLMVVAALAAAWVGAPLEGAVLLALFSLSETLEHRAMGRARRAVEALMALRPDTALKKTDSGVAEVPTASLIAGDRVILRPGARVPVDGVIRAGEGGFDEATITGESMPVHHAPGQTVLEATVNLSAVIEMEVTRPTTESTVARMIRLVTEAQAARSPSERFSDWFGQRYTVGVLLASLAAWAVFRWLGTPPDLALYRAATLLVAASPCAVVISVPAAILSALSAAARGGVLFKGGAALETLAAAKSFAFDKTGTLTTGTAEVTGLSAPGLAEDDFLALFAGLEAQSEHPIAAAIRRAAAARGLEPVPVEAVRALPSEGIVAGDGGGVGDGPLWAGNRRMLARMGVAEVPETVEALTEGAETVVWLGRGHRVLGAVTVADRPRASSAAGLQALRQGGIDRLAMMTGDRRAVADRIGEELGLKADEIHADLLPAGKVDLVAGLAAQGRVAFVGDGVNDAAALARADVGIAMGVGGSEVALQTADVALLSEDMTRLAEAHRLARRTARVIRQNLTFALGAMLVLVSGALFFDLPLPLAVVGHEGGTVLVVLNGLRLLADPIRSKG